ncbi:hypothetical protein EV191_11065 [Tamaricihabitans halophyticus]|uniref:Uncharacterized protein n=1 Tax=Tamaricihabitans halophyticus TaxID=1262583 RepID=A0A4R2QJ56_9PSEU|nr:hypothetical protein [Tamaricihabitans halophyticus]TCP48508.1 hypothetical protein EV191_11065 [Tamaricihabitans halophyticus]
MNASNSWWVSGLFTIAGVLITTLAGLGLTILNRRTERFRLSRQQKVESYPELLHAANRLARLPVWPSSAGDPHALLDDIDRNAQRVQLFAPQTVRQQVTELLAAASSLAEVVSGIRVNSKPAHGDVVDQRDAANHRHAVDMLLQATERFLSTIRIDLEVDRP